MGKFYARCKRIGREVMVPGKASTYKHWKAQRRARKKNKRPKSMKKEMVVGALEGKETENREGERGRKDQDKRRKMLVGGALRDVHPTKILVFKRVMVPTKGGKKITTRGKKDKRTQKGTKGKDTG